jgi:5'-3' exonuclease
MEHLESYKSNRDNKHKIQPGVFEMIYNQIIPRMRTSYGIRYVCVDGAEADDVIGWIHRQMPNTRKVIITNDNDYLQLADDMTVLMNLQMKNIVERGIGDPKKDLLYKILIGDVSDNITGIVPPKKAMLLVNMKEEEMYSALRKDSLYEKYLYNKRLIDMCSIPDSIEEAIRLKVRICNRS